MISKRTGKILVNGDAKKGSQMKKNKKKEGGDDRQKLMGILRV